MHDESSRARAATDPRLERALVLALLAEDDGGALTYAELGLELAVSVAAVQEAVARLSDLGVLCRCHERTSASRALRHLDQLGLIAV